MGGRYYEGLYGTLDPVPGDIYGYRSRSSQGGLDVLPTLRYLNGKERNVGLSTEEEALSQQVIGLSQDYDEAIDLLRALYHSNELDEEGSGLVEEYFEAKCLTL